MTQEQVTEQSPEQVAAESNDAFEAGFGQTRGEPVQKTEPVATTEKVEDAPPVKVEAKPEEKSEAKVEDPLSGLKAELDSVRQSIGKLDQLDHRFKSFEGRIHKIGTAVEALAAAKAAATSVAEAPSQAQVQAAAASSAKWGELKKDFPDWAEAVDERLAEMRAAIPAQAKEVDVTGLKTELSTSLTQGFQQAVATAKAEARELARVDAKHENWEQTINTPEFGMWLEKQAPDIQALAQSAKAADAIRMLDAYAAFRKEAEKKQQQKDANTQRLKSAVTPTGVPGAQPTTLNDEDAFEAGFKVGRGG